MYLCFTLREQLVQLFGASLFDCTVIWGLVLQQVLLAEQCSSWKEVWRAGYRLLVSPVKKSVVEGHSRVGVLVAELLRAGRPVCMSASIWEL